jgi:hypothetical protein
MKTTLLWVAAGSTALALSLGLHYRRAPQWQPRHNTEDMAETLTSHGIELNDAMPAPDVQRTPAAFVQPAPR